MRDVNEILEFNKIKEIVASYAVTNSAKKLLCELEVSNDYFAIEQELKNTDEALRITYRYGAVPIEFVHDIQEYLSRASKGAMLFPEELYRIASQYDGISKVQSFASQIVEENIDNFKYLANSLNPVKELKKEVDRCISPNFLIYDHASTTLANIRKEIVKKEGEVRGKLESYIRKHSDKLSDSLITVRNDRLVIPLKAQFKYIFGGIIHDQSDSGQTFYVEPEEIVQINSKLQQLHHQEQEEVERILMALSDIVREYLEDLEQNLKFLIELDFLFAKAKYGKEIDGKVATLSKKKEVYLIKARHPLLERKSVVANDLILGGENNSLLLITGPNTGGKTVVLKTLGLLVMMNQAGLIIPVDFEARLGVFDDIFVDIGDEQSIEQNLSTFSSHLSKIIDITSKVNANSLVLVDELGGGTDPKEGEALAMAILDYFHSRSANVLATTHYSNLKTFAIDVGYITNTSMVFDEEKLKPTYRMIYGVPGKSYAFTISRRLGLSNSIVEKAKDYEKHFSSENDTLIEKLQKKLQEADKIKQDLFLKEEELNKKLEKQEKLNKSLIEKQEDLIANSHERIDELVLSAKEEIDKIMEEIKIRPSSEVKLHEWIAAKKRLQDVSVFEIDEEKKESKDFEVGDSVYILKLNRTGKITRKKGDIYTIDIGKMSVDMNGSDLSIHHETKKENKIEIKAFARPTPIKPECNLIGLHVDEALLELQKYIDNALMLHMNEVRIVHGYGTGALRQAVHKYLDKQPYVDSYRLGGEGEGLFGATVVKFKK